MYSKPAHFHLRQYLSRLVTKPTKWVCAQRRLGSAWAFAQSDQSLRCPHEESLNPYLPTERTAKTLIRLGGCLHWAHSHIVGFVTRRLILFYIRRIKRSNQCINSNWLSKKIAAPNYILAKSSNRPLTFYRFASKPEQNSCSSIYTPK